MVASIHAIGQEWSQDKHIQVICSSETCIFLLLLKLCTLSFINRRKSHLSKIGLKFNYRYIFSLYVDLPFQPVVHCHCGTGMSWTVGNLSTFLKYHHTHHTHYFVKNSFYRMIISVRAIKYRTRYPMLSVDHFEIKNNHVGYRLKNS